MRRYLYGAVLALLMAPFGVSVSRKTIPQARPANVSFGTMPLYPAIARAAGIEGTVKLLIHIRKGAVVGVSVEHPAQIMLTNAARACAASWRFEKHASGVVPVTFKYTIAKPGGGDQLRVVFRMTKAEIEVTIRAQRPAPFVFVDPAPISVEKSPPAKGQPQ